MKELACPKCGYDMFNVWYRQVACYIYIASRPDDEGDKETLVETEALVALECNRCNTDLSKYKQFVRLFSKYARNGFRPLEK